MKNNIILNVLAVLILIISILWGLLMLSDDPLSWKIERFLGNDMLFWMSFLPLISVILSFISLKKTKNLYAKVIFVVSLIYFILMALLMLYISGLGSSWKN